MAYLVMSLLLCGRPVRPVTTLTDEPGPDRQPSTGIAVPLPTSGGLGELHARVGVAAVAERVLREVLLVGVLGVVVRRLAGGADLGGDLADAAAGELLAVGLGQLTRGLLLLGGRPVDRGAVLGADVVALAHALGRVVDLEELLDQVGVGHLGGVEDDPDGLGVAGPAAAHLVVGRVGRAAAGVADRRRPDTGDLPVDLLRAPEAAEAEDRDLEAVGDVVGDDGGVQDHVLAQGPHLVLAPRERLVGGGQGGGLADSEHASIVTRRASGATASRRAAGIGGTTRSSRRTLTDVREAGREDVEEIRSTHRRESSCLHVERVGSSSLPSSWASWSGAA